MAKANFTRADIRNHLNQGAARIEQQIIIRLQYLGEECVKIARELNTYMDQTGNLRSSVGYLILKNGKVIDENFVIVKEGSTGAAEGKKFAKEKGAEFSKGYALVVVCGMSYGSILESVGIDVLSSSEQYAKAKVPQMIAQLKRSITQMR
jgi:hypothetical protein